MKFHEQAPTQALQLGAQAQAMLHNDDLFKGLFTPVARLDAALRSGHPVVVRMGSQDDLAKAADDTSIPMGQKRSVMMDLLDKMDAPKPVVVRKGSPAKPTVMAKAMGTMEQNITSVRQLVGVVKSVRAA